MKRPLSLVLFGPESTGKTQLAQKLAAYYHCNWSAEFVRDYLDAKESAAQSGLQCPDPLVVHETDLLPILLGQHAAEIQARRQAHAICFHDTCLLTNQVYIDHYFGKPIDWLEHWIGQQPYDFFFLLDTSITWQPDRQREGETARAQLYDKMEHALQSRKLPYFLVEGNLDERFERIVSYINANWPLISQ